MFKHVMFSKFFDCVFQTFRAPRSLFHTNYKYLGLNGEGAQTQHRLRKRGPTASGRAGKGERRLEDGEPDSEKPFELERFFLRFQQF